jgi:hypothetical protein
LQKLFSILQNLGEESNMKISITGAKLTSFKVNSIIEQVSHFKYQGNYFS